MNDERNIAQSNVNAETKKTKDKNKKSDLIWFNKNQLSGLLCCRPFIDHRRSSPVPTEQLVLFAAFYARNVFFVFSLFFAVPL